jgi:hypothetical protein
MSTVMEINNNHVRRFADAVLCPFQRTAIGGTAFTLKKGTLADDVLTATAPSPSYPIEPLLALEGVLYSWLSAAMAFSIKGAAYLVYQVLPVDW